MPGDVDLVYQRCTAVNLQSRAKDFNTGKEMSAEVQEGVADIAEMLAEGFGRDAKEEEKKGGAASGGKPGMTVKLFVSGLIRLAWRWCGFVDHGIGLRFRKLMDCVVLPALHELLNADDPLVNVLQGRRVLAILDHYDRDLRAIFGSYAAADASVDAPGRGLSQPRGVPLPAQAGQADRRQPDDLQGDDHLRIRQHAERRRGGWR